MWFWRRRRPSPPPVLLPSLDRLAELIERVVALLDEVTLAPEAPAHEKIVLQEHNLEPAADGWVAFIHASDGYRLLERGGSPPERGTIVDLDGGVFIVLRLGPSPLPADRRPCAVLAQEQPSAERTFDR